MRTEQVDLSRFRRAHSRKDAVVNFLKTYRED